MYSTSIVKDKLAPYWYVEENIHISPDLHQSEEYALAKVGVHPVATPLGMGFNVPSTHCSHFGLTSHSSQSLALVCGRWQRHLHSIPVFDPLWHTEVKTLLAVID